MKSGYELGIRREKGETCVGDRFGKLKSGGERERACVYAFKKSRWAMRDIFPGTTREYKAKIQPGATYDREKQPKRVLTESRTATCDVQPSEGAITFPLGGSPHH
jgi:hypothetical protein